MLETPFNNGASKNSSELSEKSDDNTRVDLNVRSTEVQEIIGRPPHWLVRGGIAGILLVLGLVFAAASVVQYPEVINAPIRLTAINEPKTLESKISGKIEKLPLQNNQSVDEGQIIAWLESTANHEDIIRLSSKVDSISKWLENRQLQKIRTADFFSFSSLGEIQTNFQTFEQSYRDFLTYLPGGFYSERRQILNQELNYTRQLWGKLEKQKEIQQVNLELARKEYEAQKKLSEKGLAAPIELARAENELASSRLPVYQTESAIINNQSSQTAKKKELMDLDKEISEQKSVFRQAINTLKSTIDQWKSDHFITSPIAGKLIYTGIIQENQTVQAGQQVFYVQPANSQFFGEMKVSQRSFGKIHEGQKVVVRFSGYPDREFGSVTGKIEYLSAFPVQDSVFLAKVNFQAGFETNYGNKITPTNGMTGQAEIITQDMRFIERIYNNLTKDLR